MLIRLIVCQLFWIFLPVNGFNLPGTNPIDYLENDTVPLNTNRLASTNWDDRHGRLGFTLSHDYYSRPFNFCRPKDGPRQLKGNLGSLLFGDRIYNTPFELQMLKNVSCQVLCSTNWTDQEAAFLAKNIFAGLGYFWNIDNLPLVYENNKEVHRPFSAGGFPLGIAYLADKKPMAAIYNHFDFKLEYHQHAADLYRVVGATVTPSSRLYTSESLISKCQSDVSWFAVPVENSPHLSVPFTYSVKWIPSDLKWASRWDKYLEVHDSNIHWIALFNASFLTVVICAALAQVASKVIRKDINNILQSEFDANVSVSGWKYLKNSCLRSPKNTLLLSVLVGNGCHLFFLLLMTIIFSGFGFLSPEHRGGLATVAIYIYSFSSIIAGYVGAYCFKYFKGDDSSVEDGSENTIIKTSLTLWNMLFLLTPTLVPGLILGSFLILNFLVLFQGSSGAVPFPTILNLIGLWFFVSIPSSLIGSFIAKKKGRTSQYGYQPLDYARNLQTSTKEIPRLPFYLKPYTRLLFGGFLPFFAISIELSYIIDSLWLHKIYYMFGFLFISCIIMVISSIIMTIGVVYLMLLAGDYRWQWSSFGIAGSVGIYIYFSSIILLLFRISNGAGLVGTLLYLVYSFIISASIFLITGSLGFLCTWMFIHGIYSAVRID